MIFQQTANFSMTCYFNMLGNTLITYSVNEAAFLNMINETMDVHLLIYQCHKIIYIYANKYKSRGLLVKSQIQIRVYFLVLDFQSNCMKYINDWHAVNTLQLS